MVEGRLKLDQWEDKTSGQKRSKLKVVLDNVQFLTTRGAAGGGGRTRASQTPNREPQLPFCPKAARAPAAAKEAARDEDVPF